MDINKKTITVDGKEVSFKASALTPRLYRAKFGKDMIAEMQKLTKDYVGVAEGNSESLTIESLECFENVAWIMAYQADSSIPEPEEWLDGFGMFSIYEVFPVIMELWSKNNATTSKPKKR